MALLNSLTGFQIICGADRDLRMVGAKQTSYKREVLTNCRDESFNSITGLNGSGKSNILDSICFVLGITNMSTVRAQNLQVCADRRHQVIGTLTD